MTESRASPRGDLLILFYKQPIPGKVKTRVARDIGNDAAARLYKAMLEDLHHRFRDLPVEVRPSQAGGRPIRFEGWQRGSRQRGADIGKRMSRAFQIAFGRGAGRTILIGSDIPGLTSQNLLRCFDSLERQPMCLGPSRDGGYYLIGFREDGFAPALFRGVNWSSDTVLDETLTVARSLGLSPYLAPTLDDADTLADIVSYIRTAPANTRSCHLTQTAIDLGLVNTLGQSPSKVS